MRKTSAAATCQCQETRGGTGAGRWGPASAHIFTQQHGLCFDSPTELSGGLEAATHLLESPSYMRDRPLVRLFVKEPRSPPRWVTPIQCQAATLVVPRGWRRYASEFTQHQWLLRDWGRRNIELDIFGPPKFSGCRPETKCKLYEPQPSTGPVRDLTQ